MYFNIYVIYHSDIFRKQHIDNILSKLFYKPNIQYIYSHLNNKNITNIDNNISINENLELLDHIDIWNKIITNNNDSINLIIDDSIDINNKTFNIHQILTYLDSLLDDLFTNKTCDDWNIFFLYEQNYTTDFNEIQITDKIVIPSNRRLSHKAYFITYNSAKILADINPIDINISKFFYNIQYNCSNYNINCWSAFTSKKTIFIDDRKNEDITQYVYSYNIKKKPYKIDIQTIHDGIISKYLTIILFVEKYKDYHYFKRVFNYFNSFGYHVIPIFYEDNKNDNEKTKLFLNEFHNLYSKNNNDHYLLISSVFNLIINIDISRLISFFDTLRCDILYSNSNNCSSFLDSLYAKNIILTKYSKLYNIINRHNNIDFSFNSTNFIYNNNQDLFFSIEKNVNPIKFKYDTDIKLFYYKDRNNVDTFPLFIYSTNYDILFDDILNIHPFRGKLIKTNLHYNNLYKTNKLLILIYINLYSYTFINSDIDKWINNYKNRFILPSNIVDTDIILYTDNIVLYDKIVTKYKINIQYVNNIVKYFISMLQFAETEYRYIFSTTAYHNINNIYTIYDLIYTDQSIIVPLICGYKKNKKTISIIDINDRIINRQDLGIWVVPYIKDSYLLNANVYSDIILYMSKNDKKENESFEEYFMRCVKYYNIPIWCSNVRIYGVDIRI
jgi:hypothetical protein